MRSGYLCAIVLFLFGCGSGPYVPTVPLTHTPDDGWRAQAPKVSVVRDVSMEKPLLIRQAVDGTTLVIAQISSALYTSVTLVARQPDSYAQSDLVVNAMIESLRLRNGRAPAPERIDALGLTLSYHTTEVAEFEDALTGFRELLKAPPPSEAFARARTEYLRRSGAALTHFPVSVLHQALLEQLFSVWDPIVRGPELHLRARSHSLDDEHLTRAYYRLFQPARRALIIVGPQSPEEALARAEQPLSPAWPEAPLPGSFGDNAARANPFVLVDQPVNMPVVGFAMRVPTADWVSAELMQRLIVSSLQGGLHGSIRENQGLTYSVSCSFEEGPNGGLLWGWFQVDEYKAGRAAQLLKKELGRLAQHFETHDLEGLQNAALLDARLTSRSPRKLSASLARRFARNADWSKGPHQELIEASLGNVQSSLKRILAQPYLAIAGNISNVAASVQWTGLTYAIFEPLAN